MSRKGKQQGRGLFDAAPASEERTTSDVSLFPRACRLCSAKGMHYFHGDGTKPIESWCGHCSTWSRLVDQVWKKCEPVKKSPERPGPSEPTPGGTERESQ